MARTYSGTAPASAIGLPDFNPGDDDVLGAGLTLRRNSVESPIARAVQLNAKARATAPAADLLRGSPQPAATRPAQAGGYPPVPAAPTPMIQPPAPTPQVTEPPATYDPLPGAGGPYDPSRLNYEGETYQGPPVQKTQPTIGTPTDAQVQQISDFMTAKEIAIDRDWRNRLYADPKGFVAYLREQAAKSDKDTGLDYTRAADYIESILKGTQTSVDPAAASQYYDQAAYNQARERLRQTNLGGAREEEEQILGMLESRGLLNSGIAAQELSRLRENRTRLYQEGAARLNEILFSNASDQAKREAILRLQNELETASQQQLLRLRYQLEQDLQESQRGNEWLNQLAGIAGAGLSLLSPAAPALYGGTQQILADDRQSNDGYRVG